MRLIAAIATVCLLFAVTMPMTAQNPFIGSWNLTGLAPDTTYVYWLEVKEEAGQLSGMFLNRSGNPVPLAVVKAENGELVFQGGKPGAPTGPEYRARFENGKLVGRHTLTQGGGRAGADGTPAPPPTQRVVNWVGAKRPTWPKVNANGKHAYGAPVVLFDGKSLDAFDLQIPNRPIGFTIADGIASNQKGANNLVSKQKFTDFKVEAEYKLEPASNSGIYLRGRYELQVLDDFNDTTTRRDLQHMAIYGRTPASVKASKPAGEWQSMEAIIVGNRVTVTLNGQRVHDNAEILGITGGALDNDELAPGPIMIQGDHTGVAIRRVVVTPITKAGQ